jgi:hypothetical protein
MGTSSANAHGAVLLNPSSRARAPQTRRMTRHQSTLRHQDSAADPLLVDDEADRPERRRDDPEAQDDLRL